MIFSSNEIVINRYISRSLLCVAISLAAVASAFAQSSFDRPRVYDVVNYTIRVGFDAPKKTVDGDTTVTLTPLSARLHHRGEKQEGHDESDDLSQLHGAMLSRQRHPDETPVRVPTPIT